MTRSTKPPRARLIYFDNSVSLSLRIHTGGGKTAATHMRDAAVYGTSISRGALEADWALDDLSLLRASKDRINQHAEAMAKRCDQLVIEAIFGKPAEPVTNTTADAAGAGTPLTLDAIVKVAKAFFAEHPRQTLISWSLFETGKAYVIEVEGETLTLAGPQFWRRARARWAFQESDTVGAWCAWSGVIGPVGGSMGGWMITDLDPVEGESAEREVWRERERDRVIKILQAVLERAGLRLRAEPLWRTPPA